VSAREREVARRQRLLNAFTKRWLENVAPIMVDGDQGHAMNTRIRTVKWYVGYTGKARHSSRWTEPFEARLRAPKGGRVPEPMKRRGERRRGEQREDAHDDGPNVVTFDGRPVAAWLKPYLEWARENGWRGTLNSGFRSPEHSERLCFQICGRPTCPGRCAGRGSNHTKAAEPEGAVDVSDFATFARLMKRCPLRPRIFNALGAADPVHFSASGR
jgi:hypothetical protein